MDSIVFITVNHNCFSETKNYISNIISLKGCYKKHIIIVDNSTTEEDFDKINNYINENNFNLHVNVIRTNNEGYFQGLNRGIDYSKKNNLNPEFYIIGNNDIIFHENFIEILFKLDIKNNELIIAPDVITNDGSHENPHSSTRVKKIKKISFDIYFSNFYIARLINLFYRTDIRKYKPYNPYRQDVYMAIGAIYILTNNFFNYFDRLWEMVFLYGEEAVLAGQINSVNGKIIYEPLLKCYHNESSTTSKINNKEKYKMIQNSYKVYRKFL
jgi:GT2 family glycosyltransferase